jgi:hypothetical protein
MPHRAMESEIHALTLTAITTEKNVFPFETDHTYNFQDPEAGSISPFFEFLLHSWILPLTNRPIGVAPKETWWSGL